MQCCPNSCNTCTPAPTTLTSAPTTYSPTKLTETEAEAQDTKLLMDGSVFKESKITCKSNLLHLISESDLQGPWKEYKGEQCVATSAEAAAQYAKNPEDGRQLDNPIFNGGGFSSFSTLEDCKAQCVKKAGCKGFEWSNAAGSTALSTTSANCALAWACSSVSGWGSGTSYQLTEASVTSKKVDEHVYDCAMDAALGGLEETSSYQKTFCLDIEDSISAISPDTVLCSIAKRCKSANLICGTGSGFRACA